MGVDIGILISTRLDKWEQIMGSSFSKAFMSVPPIILQAL
jgi:hypothetical protein